MPQGIAPIRDFIDVDQDLVPALLVPDLTSRVARVADDLRSPALAIDLPGRRHRPADLGSVSRLDREALGRRRSKPTSEVVEPGKMGLEAPAQLFEPVTWAGVPDVPRTYVRALRDRVIPPDHALVMAANGRADDVGDLDAEHDVAASAPAGLAALLDAIAARYR